MAADQHHDQRPEQNHSRGRGRDDDGRTAMVCPECGEPVRQRPPTALAPAGTPPTAWSHTDGEPLCPVMTQDGYAPARPVPLHAITGDDIADHDGDGDGDGDHDDDLDAEEDGARVERGARFHNQLTAGATPDGVAAEHGAGSDEVTGGASQFDVRVLADDADDADADGEAHEL
jgi:hypothetical protein